MKSPLDFLLIYPHPDFLAYSQRVLLGVLSDAGYRVHLITVASDKNLLSDPALREEFMDTVARARVVGFGFMSTGYPMTSRLTKAIKSEFPDKLVVWGGPHPTDSYHQMVGEADAIFVGESEVMLQRFMEAVDKGEPFDELPLVVTSEPRFKPSEPGNYVDDLDTLPMPFYAIDGQTHITENALESSKEFFLKNFKSLQMLTSRGCTY